MALMIVVTIAIKRYQKKLWINYLKHWVEDKMICPFCNKPAEWVENKEVYGRNYGKSFMIWLCKPCDAYVGCHENTKKPLGVMANRETREWRVKAHEAFDPIWKEKVMTRQGGYKWLRERLGRRIHIGESDIETCRAIIELCKLEPHSGEVKE